RSPGRPGFEPSCPHADLSPCVRPSVQRPTAVSGGRSWWAHRECTRINIELTILPEKAEDLMNVRGIGEKNFLKLKPLVTVASARTAAP
ncbi:MAG TPA: hypothetical protein VNN99_15070, partial [Vicinamibacterales bacterium]|nr:hypothetical protein [Vicinamibacterales bacterium]